MLLHGLRGTTIAHLSRPTTIYRPTVQWAPRVNTGFSMHSQRPFGLQSRNDVTKSEYNKMYVQVASVCELVHTRMCHLIGESTKCTCWRGPSRLKPSVWWMPHGFSFPRWACVRNNIANREWALRLWILHNLSVSLVAISHLAELIGRYQHKLQSKSMIVWNVSCTRNEKGAFRHYGHIWIGKGIVKF